MNITNSISIIALFISLISLSFTIFSFLRDRSKIDAWSELYYTFSNDPNDCYKTVPNLKIRIANSGRRPIVITSLIKVSSDSGFLTEFIISPKINLSSGNDGTLSNLPKIEDFSVQNTSVVLNEGQAFELFIRHNDGIQELTIVNHKDGEYYDVEKLYIEDVLKNKIYIKNSKENIKKFWKDFDRASWDRANQ